MKTAQFVGLLVFATTALALPRNRRSEANQIHARADSGEVTITAYSTEETPSVTVYVNPKGLTLSVVTASTTGSTAANSSAPASTVTSTNTGTSSSAISTGASSSATSSSSSSSMKSSSASSGAIPSSIKLSATPTTASSSATSTKTSSSSLATTTLQARSSTSVGKTSSTVSSASTGVQISKIKAIVYSPYAPTRICKTAAQIKQDWSQMPSGYNMVRLYGVDCEQVKLVAPLAKAKGMKLFLGIDDVTAVTAGISAIGTALGGDWSQVHTISIGNEVVNKVITSGNQPAQLQAAVQSVTTALKQAKQALKGKGPKVVTTDTFNAAMEYPELCKQSDYIAVNMHPYWDPNVDGSTKQVASWMQGSIKNVQAKCGSAKVVITETGWPWKQTGGVLDKRLSVAIQKTALEGIAQASSDFVVLSAYNDPWKDPGAQGTEQWWGVGGKNAPSQGS